MIRRGGQIGFADDLPWTVILGTIVLVLICRFVFKQGDMLQEKHDLYKRQEGSFGMSRKQMFGYICRVAAILFLLLGLACYHMYNDIITWQGLALFELIHAAFILYAVWYLGIKSHYKHLQ